MSAKKKPAPAKAKAKPRAKRKPRPKRPPGLAKGRWLGDFPRLSAAEKKFVKCCTDDVGCVLAAKRPEEETVGNRIRAGLIRFMLLGGDSKNPVHEHGVQLVGAWVDGPLDLDNITADVGLKLMNCHFSAAFSALDATLPLLALRGSQLSGLSADGMEVKGSVFLNGDFKATGEVRLLGATIGGDLTCSGGQFDGRDSDALSADGMEVKGNVFLNGDFNATGKVRLLGATIGGTLTCSGGQFDGGGGDALNADLMEVKGGVFLKDDFKATGKVRLLGATIGSTLTCSGGQFDGGDSDALNVQGAIIKNGLIIRNGQFNGAIDLTVTYVGTLVDDTQCWGDNALILDGFHYDRIIGPMDARHRIAWLKKQRSDQLSSDFRPQPWEQLIHVLRDMGHGSEAADIAIAKQEAMRKAGQIGLRHVKGFEDRRFPRLRRAIDRLWNPLSNTMTKGWHRIYGALAGYGHRPSRILYIMVAVCCLSSLAYYAGRHDGLIAPADPLVHLNSRYAHCGTGGDPGKDFWTSSQCGVAPEYSTFQPFLYSIDLILPLVDIQQEADWAPVVQDQSGRFLWGGWLIRLIMWLEILFGWFASLMLIAIVGRLVEKE